MAESQRLQAPFDLVKSIAEKGRLPVPNFASGGITSPADAALMMQLGADSIFVGSCLFQAENPARAAAGIVSAVRYYTDPEMLSKISCGHLSPIPNVLSPELKKEEIFTERDWN
jgi:pyridoxal 5'-phosphate synthase pdxS subunit